MQSSFDMEPRREETTKEAKGVGILARSLFRQMREQGYSAEQIIGLSSALIELVRLDLVRAPGPQ